MALDRVTPGAARRVVTLLVATPLVLVLLGSCGQDEPAEGPVPGTPWGTGASRDGADPDPSPAATFEDSPQVTTLRAFYVAAGRSINDRDRKLSKVRPHVTPAGLAMAREVFADDLAKGHVWPGPEPFTPIAVEVRGDRADVTACLLASGWSRDRETGASLRKREIIPVLYELRDQGSWKLEHIYDAEADCGGVDVEEVEW